MISNYIQNVSSKCHCYNLLVRNYYVTKLMIFKIGLVRVLFFKRSSYPRGRNASEFQILKIYSKYLGMLSKIPRGQKLNLWTNFPFAYFVILEFSTTSHIFIMFKFRAFQLCSTLLFIYLFIWKIFKVHLLGIFSLL